MRLLATMHVTNLFSNDQEVVNEAVEALKDKQRRDWVLCQVFERTDSTVEGEKGYNPFMNAVDHFDQQRSYNPVLWTEKRV